jgi:hypothetical protein
MWSSKDGYALTKTPSMDVSQPTSAVAPTQVSMENYRAGMPRPLKSHEGSREFHSVPELKDYVSLSNLC